MESFFKSLPKGAARFEIMYPVSAWQHARKSGGSGVLFMHKPAYGTMHEWMQNRRMGK